jgi:RNA polymerase sigma-70 factor (sigma-E family)
MDLSPEAAPAAPSDVPWAQRQPASAAFAGTTAARDRADSAAAVTALYRDHALSLIRVAHIMLGSRSAAEDVVQDAFLGLYRRWEHLTSADKALGYVRTSVLNGCRTALRRGRVGEVVLNQPPRGRLAQHAISAEAAVLSVERRGEIIRALRGLPSRQREVLVLRYYLDLTDEQVAEYLGIRPGTIRSTRHRALASLARTLGETS